MPLYWVGLTSVATLNLYGEKLSWIEWSPELPWANQLFLHFPYKTQQTVDMRDTKLARVEAGSPFVSALASLQGQLFAI